MNVNKLICLTGFTTLLFVCILAAGYQAALPATDKITTPLPTAVPAPKQVPANKTPAPRQVPSVITSIAPRPVPTPETASATAAAPATNRAASMLLPLMLLLLSPSLLLVWSRRRSMLPKKDASQKRLIGQGLAALLCLFLLGCQSPAADPLPPDDYLEHALNWLEANAVTAVSADWQAIRTEAIAIANQPQTIADTYAAIAYAIAQINDPHAYFRTPEIDVWERADLGLTAVYPQNIITEVKSGSAAEEAAIQVGDQLLTINGLPPLPLENRARLVNFPPEGEVAQAMTLQLQRGGEQWEVTLIGEVYENEGAVTAQAVSVGEKTAVHLTLFTDLGSRLFPTRTHNALAAAVSDDTCGWIIDLRRNHGGNLWSYFAALSPHFR